MVLFGLIGLMLLPLTIWAVWYLKRASRSTRLPRWWLLLSSGVGLILGAGFIRVEYYTDEFNRWCGFPFPSSWFEWVEHRQMWIEQYSSGIILIPQMLNFITGLGIPLILLAVGVAIRMRRASSRSMLPKTRVDPTPHDLLGPD